MGKLLLDMYNEAKMIGGFGAQVRLAILTKMPSVKAQQVPDTPENIAIFRNALAIIQKEFNELKETQ